MCVLRHFSCCKTWWIKNLNLKREKQTTARDQMHTAKRRGKTDGAGERGMCIKPWCYGCRQNKMLVVCLLLLLTDCKKVKYCYNSSVTGCSVSCLLEWFIICAESKMLVVFVCVLLTLTKKNGYIIMQAAMCCVTGNHWGFLVFFVRFVLEGASW